MKKLKLQAQMSIDGFIAGPNNEMDWMQWNWDEKLKQYVAELNNNMDTILMGRKMAGEFNAHWTRVANDANDAEQVFGKMLMDTPKYVFSKTIKTIEGRNTTVSGGDLVTEVNRLKKEKGKDMIVYGGADFVGSLIGYGLIDELHLLVDPAAIGKGKPIFNKLENKQDFSLMKTIGFDCGIVLLHYAKKISA